MRKLGILLFGVGLLAVAGCGSGGTTTVIKESAPTTVEKTTTVQAPAPQPRHVSNPTPPSAEPEAKREPPNVVGLPLPAAEQVLSQAGYKAAATNTDTAFGIVVKSNYTICTEGPPRGNFVPVLAQKYGC
jgi:hypothetical protein